MRFSDSNRPCRARALISGGGYNRNHWTTAGYTLRCLLAQRLSPPSPFYNFNFDPDIHQRL